MTRRSTISSSFCRVAVPLLALGLAGCSFSFKAGGDSSAEGGKPAVKNPDDGAAPAGKPIADADADAGASEEPEVSPVKPAVHEPAPVVEPMTTAVCRVQERSLIELCHSVFDPIAADDLAGWEQQLALEIDVLHPSYDGHQRVHGVRDVRETAQEVGGLRSLLHLEATDRIVATMHNDCRECRRPTVAFEVNSRSGTIIFTVDMSKPPRISQVEIGSQLQRRPLLEAAKSPMVNKPGPKPEPAAEPAQKEPAAEKEPSKTLPSKKTSSKTPAKKSTLSTKKSATVEAKK